MNKLRFLIVEDHEFQRVMLKQALLALGAEIVHSAGNGLQAMDFLRDPGTPVDIVITDLMMPEVDGIELIPLLGRAAKNVALVFASSAEGTIGAAVEIAKAHGVFVLGTLTKPITPDKLRQLLDQYVARSPA
ncbi:MAG: response regulator receiver (CheY-like) modulated diguanylate phosphodiesterase domain [Ramlibacter sp.]|nr:response regulator receiver (CheY-like) modulated diguanylate phosphodiesterase domain [Ramlibacter sp.]